MEDLSGHIAEPVENTGLVVEGGVDTANSTTGLKPSETSAAISETETLDRLVGQMSDTLAVRLQLLSKKLYPPKAQKTLRRFSSSEAASFIGIDPSYLRRLDAENRGPKPFTDSAGRRFYTAREMNEIRLLLDQSGKSMRRHVMHRRDGEQIQVICVTNFKGGSGKTTTATHLAQYLALRGYRVLGLDLDPQASFTALHGLQPEFDVAEGKSLYGAIRYGTKRRPMVELVRKTYFDGLDFVPGNIDIQEFEHDVPKDLVARQAGTRTGETQFYVRLQKAIREVEHDYDVVVVDCPPQMGYLTMAALTAATSLIVTIHPAMVDVMSMSQFLGMTADYMKVVADTGIKLRINFLRYLITRFEPGDAPQSEMVGMLRELFPDHVMTHPMLKTTAVNDANLSKQTIYEVFRSDFTPSTYDRAMESLSKVNGEVEGLINAAWGRA